MVLPASSVSAPMTTRSGLIKSSSATPSFKNSGFETTSNGCFVSCNTTAFTFSAVPTGTVDLSTMILYPFIALPISFATERTIERSASPSAPVGVPTAMNMMSDFSTPSCREVVKLNLFRLTLCETISESPGS